MRKAPSKKHRLVSAHHAARCGVTVLALLLTGTAAATDFLAGERNRAPLAGVFLLNAVDVTDAPAWTADWTTASHSARDGSQATGILFDGETSMLTLGFNATLSDRWSAAVSAPYVWHSAGALDGFIDGWHDAFGLPDGIRNERPDDTLEFRYTDAGNDVFNLSRNTKGIGDMTLGARRQLGDLSGPWSLLLGLKLPTGSAEKLTGSGSADATVALGWQQQSTQSGWSFDANLGAAFLGDADLTLRNQNDTVVFGQLSAARRITQALTLGARIQVHTAALSNGPDPLSDTAVALVLGGSLALGRDWQLNITVTEDLSVEVLPDVTFRVGLAFKR
ncbi:MAG: DUF3187 family protein [Pseudomonadota bacterium]